MKKTGTGLLWSLPDMWEVGKNCHLENIVCPHCQSLETACVLHTQGEPWRSHLCQNCGGHIMQGRWKLATIAGNQDARSTEQATEPPYLVASQKKAVPDPLAVFGGASCDKPEQSKPGTQSTLF